MAPNTKQINLIVQQLSPADLGLAKAHFAPLTQEVPAPQKQELSAQEKNDYWTWEEPEQLSEQDSYWDWSSNPAQDVLSSNNIVKNLVKSHKEQTEMIRSNVNSDSYWDETTAKDAEVQTVTAQHVNEEAVESYWEWSADVDERKATVERILKDEKIRQMLTAEHITANLRQEASDMYWNEAEIERHADSGNYWDESPASARPVPATGGYWEW